MQKTCGIWINILSHMIKRRLNATMQRLGLTGVQGHVMHFIVLKCADGPVYQRDVEAAFGLSRSTATGILQLMEKNGLIQRESAADDARLKSLIPTEKAAELEEEVMASIRQTDELLIKGLTQEQVKQFCAVAAHMCANLEE